MAIGKPLILIDGVRGSWGRDLTPSRVHVRLTYWTQVTATERRAVERAVESYARLGRTSLASAWRGGARR
jgi:hypothetical protein